MFVIIEINYIIVMMMSDKGHFANQ